MTSTLRPAASLFLAALCAVAPASAAVIETDPAIGRLGNRAVPAVGSDGNRYIDVLQSARPILYPMQTKRVAEIDAALTATVSAAAAEALEGTETTTRSRGSTTRGTYTSDNPDYDVSVALPAGSPEEFEQLLRLRATKVQETLMHHLHRMATELFPEERTSLSSVPTRDISDPQSGRASGGVKLFRFAIKRKGAGRNVKVDVTLTNSPRYANAYPEYFAEQLTQVLARDGEHSAQRLLADIRLAKKFFQESVGAYKFYDGGPSAVGIEQMVMQSGLVTNHDQGRTVLETGTFDKMTARLNSAAYDEKGRLRTFEAFEAAWMVHNPFQAPANFLSLMRSKYRKVAAAVRNYEEAKLAGRPVTLRDLSLQRDDELAPPEPPPATKPVTPATAPEPSSPGALTLRLLERFATQGPRPLERGEEYLLAQGAKTLPPGFEAAWSARAARPLPKGPHVANARVLFMRGPGRTYVMMPSISGAGEKVMRPLDVEPALVQGVVSDTFVEIAYAGGRVLGVRPIGAYPQDMMVGRIVRRDGRLRLEGLFRENGGTSSLYEPLTMKDGITAQEGSIVQAFVRPAGDGYEAVPLFNLGEALTPEIAAREIALRRGARGYFEEAVVRQVEAEGRAEDSAGDYKRLKERISNSGRGERVEDLRTLPFVTIDPPGAGDLDDAYHIVREADGTYTWLLATADVAHYVRPGTPGFRAAARVGNTFYSIDKDGVGEYPMNHPVVSKHLASLLDGKDSLAMITRMRFAKDGRLLTDESEVFLGLVRVQGRYTYEQVADMWKGGAAHGISHSEQVSLARELSKKLTALDVRRGKLDLSIDRAENVKVNGVWGKRVAADDPVLNESHRLIEELKVYGNRVIAKRLNAITSAADVPHISRVHPEQNDGAQRRFLQNLQDIGVPWTRGSLAEYLESVRAREDLSPAQKQLAQWLALTSRQSAKYVALDFDGHEGLALEQGSYDHPSAPIRRFADMYNRTVLEASLEGGDPKAVYDAMLADLRSLGFASLDEYLNHLNGREQAARKMESEVDAFMSLVELGKPENVGRAFSGYVRMVRGGRIPSAVIQLEGSAATVVLAGAQAEGLKLLQRLRVTVRGVDLESRRLDVVVSRDFDGRSDPIVGTQRPRTMLEEAFEAARLNGSSGRRGPPRSRAHFAHEPEFVVNDEGVLISGRAAQYYREVRRLVELYGHELDLSDTLDVMDDSSADVVAKISAVEAIAKGRGVSRSNTHLPGTLVWVDGLIRDHGRKIAVHTFRVFYHRAKNRDSEIREGIRRVDEYINEALRIFVRGGRAEEAHGKLDEIDLVFETRGYAEIKEHIRRRGVDVAARSKGRILFKFLDDLAPIPQDVESVRAELNLLVKKYKGGRLSRIIEGVIYSRYVGLLLELKTLEHYHKLGYKTLQSGRELFDENGHYVTELDAVVQAPDGKTILVEAKSARVLLPKEQVLQDKVVYKLKTYRAFQAKLDAMIGRPFDAVVFAVDIGLNPEDSRDAEDVGPRGGRMRELATFLRSKEAELSAEYGFPVSFLFLQSGPGEGRP